MSQSFSSTLLNEFFSWVVAEYARQDFALMNLEARCRDFCPIGMASAEETPEKTEWRKLTAEYFEVKIERELFKSYALQAQSREYETALDMSVAGVSQLWDRFMSSRAKAYSLPLEAAVSGVQSLPLVPS